MNEKQFKNINVKSILKFTMPTIIMMVFMSIYQMVDAVFVSNLVGTDALSAVNIAFPPISFVIGVSIMLGSGGSAIIGKSMGEGKYDRARSLFSLIVFVGIGLGVIIAILGYVFLDNIVWAMGSDEALYQYCYDYLLGLVFFTPLAVLQMLFSCFFPAAGKPNLGLFVVVLGGLSNIFFDYFFMGVLKVGVIGASFGTGIGYSIPAIFGMIYFSVCRKGTLYFVKPKWEGRTLLRACLNGSSEMVTNCAAAVTTFLFNYMMMKFLGSDGVAAITVALYVQFFLSSVYMGYSGGVAPIISYKYGSQDIPALKKIIKISIGFVFVNSIIWFAISYFLKNELIGIFSMPGTPVWDIADAGWMLFIPAFLITGFNIFASSMFTALSNGLVSALISFLRTFGFLVASILLLPLVFDVNGVWLSIPVAELCTLVVSVICFFKQRKRYKYL